MHDDEEVLLDGSEILLDGPGILLDASSRHPASEARLKAMASQIISVLVFDLDGFEEMASAVRRLANEEHERLRSLVASGAVS